MTLTYKLEENTNIQNVWIYKTFLNKEALGYCVIDLCTFRTMLFGIEDM